MGWQTVIGLEVHARLLTQSKIFCGCPSAYGAPPNSQVCPVCLGYPGALPVLNRRSVELAVRMALATRCTVHAESIFARKNYFYPDLPKGYQISQFDKPLATAGVIPIRTKSGAKEIPIQRIHMEEDAGKSMHQFPFEDVAGDVSLVDLNRSGTALIEIVTEPAISSAEEAIAYLNRLRQILMYTEVCDGNMEEGSMRCDANVSVRREGESLGTRAEVKNLNSFRFLGKAIEFETERQIALLESGQRVVQETRLFDPGAGETRSMRSKEEAHDYRYFPEPDLPPLILEKRWIEEIRESLPLLPEERLRRYEDELGMPVGDSETLVASRSLADYFEATIAETKNVRSATNWVRNEVVRVLNDKRLDAAEFPLSPRGLARLVDMIDSGQIGGKAAKEIFEEISVSGEDPAAVVERKGLTQVSDPAVIRAAAEKVVEASAAQVAQYRSGKTALFGYFVGQVMKEMRGKANAELTNDILHQLLDS